jgi:putative hydrolase of the HAD superfamily
VLFDLDGTLLDHDTASAASLRAWLPSYGLNNDEIQAAVPLWFELEQRHYPAWRAGEISFQEQRRRRIRDFLPAIGVTVGEGRLDAVFAEHLAGYQASWVAFDDAEPALRRVAAAGLRIGVLTNGFQAQQIAKLDAIGLRDLCGPVFASSELPAGKPDPRAYVEACQRLRVEPGHTMMVGDNYELDVLAARAAGLAAIHLDRSAHRSEPADRRITTCMTSSHDQSHSTTEPDSADSPLPAFTSSTIERQADVRCSHTAGSVLTCVLASPHAAARDPTC